jgi:hypothetical protein
MVTPCETPGGSTNHIASESRQRIHDRLDQAAATAAGFKTAGHKQSDSDSDSESDQSRFAGILATVTNHSLVLFVQAPIRLIINLACLPLSLIHHIRAAPFKFFARGVGDITCCRWSHMISPCVCSLNLLSRTFIDLRFAGEFNRRFLSHLAGMPVR